MAIGASLKANLGPPIGTIIYAIKPSGFDIFALDVTTRRTTVDEVDVTEFPVEASTSFANDNVTLQPTSLQVAGVLTDLPLSYLSGMLRGPGAAADAYEKLVTLMNKGEPVNVLTDLRFYTDMAIRGITVDEDASSGDAVFLTISLRKVHILSTITTPVVLDAAALLAGGAGTADIGLLPGAGL